MGRFAPARVDGSPSTKTRRVFPWLCCLAILVGAACGDDRPVPPAPATPGLLIDPDPREPATIEQLTGPWRPTPLVLSERMRARLEQTCRGDMQRMPGSRAGVIDVRGAGVAVVRMVGESAGPCDALQITDDGLVTGAGGGSGTDGVEVLPPLGSLVLETTYTSTVEGGELDVTGFSVMGRAGDGIAAVTVEPPGRGPILATLENGWFAAWWPAPAGVVHPRGGAPNFPAVIVRGYDASGGHVFEQTFANR